MSRFFDFFRRKMTEEDLDAPEELSSEEELVKNPEQLIPVRQRKLDMHNPMQRGDYVDNCVARVEEAGAELERLEEEYARVTSLLTDMEEIESLPPEDKTELCSYALKIENLQVDRVKYREKKDRLPDDQFEAMERIGEEAEEGIAKLKGAEEYHEKIRKDLRRLDGERSAYQYRRRELQRDMANYKGMAMICLVALMVCFVMLVILQMAFHLDTQLGYMLTAAAAAVVTAFLFARYMDAKKELRRVENTINRLIGLQNTVKIRYVNNKNLIDYLCLKYKVKNGQQFERMYKKYLEEKEERQHFMEMEDDLNRYKSLLVQLLRRYRVKTPEIWIHQAQAIFDNREMVEIRHRLILQRQELRKQMDYNKATLEMTRSELDNLLVSYPQYADEIREKYH
ncbi:MAG: hypothetical protein K5682_01525 [Lachnospiraceae bacterium]|nr:hypothetical protein [Lachnospiraceae bacterium]